MTPKILLRIASAIILVHNIPHTIGHLNWKSSEGDVNRKVIDAMTQNQFEFMGRTTSYATFYDGYGYGGTLTMLLVMAVLWILSGDQSAHSRRLILVTGIFLTAWGIMEYVYFFPLAAAFSIASAILTFVAYGKSST